MIFNVKPVQQIRFARRTVVEKLGLKPSMKAYLLNAPVDFPKQVETSVEKVSNRLVGEFDYIHFFANLNLTLKKKFFA